MGIDVAAAPDNVFYVVFGNAWLRPARPCMDRPQVHWLVTADENHDGSVRLVATVERAFRLCHSQPTAGSR
jgi:hypothetical protein